MRTPILLHFGIFPNLSQQKHEEQKKWKIRCLCCTLRSGLHEISTMIRTFPCGLENNHACKWISDNFPVITHMPALMENCRKSICMHGCSPIHKEKS